MRFEHRSCEEKKMLTHPARAGCGVFSGFNYFPGVLFLIIANGPVMIRILLVSRLTVQSNY